MKQCPKCGAAFPDEQNFCIYCGVKLNPAPVQEPPKPEPEKPVEPPKPKMEQPVEPPKPKMEQPVEPPKPEPEKPVEPPKSKKEAPEALPLTPPLPVKKAKSFKTPFLITLVVMVLAIAAAVFFLIKMTQYHDLYNSERVRYSDASDELEDVLRDYDALSDQLDETTDILAQTSLELAASEGELEELRRFSDLAGLYGYASDNFYAEQGVIVLYEGETATVDLFAGLDGTYRFRVDRSGLDGEWSHEWSDNATTLNFTGNAAGAYIITFYTDFNSETFDILAVVLD